MHIKSHSNIWETTGSVLCISVTPNWKSNCLKLQRSPYFKSVSHILFFFFVSSQAPLRIFLNASPFSESSRLSSQRCGTILQPPQPDQLKHNSPRWAFSNSFIWKNKHMQMIFFKKLVKFWFTACLVWQETHTYRFFFSPAVSASSTNTWKPIHIRLQIRSVYRSVNSKFLQDQETFLPNGQ